MKEEKEENEIAINGREEKIKKERQQEEEERARIKSKLDFMGVDEVH